MNFVVIDNCVVSKNSGGGNCICSLKLAQKKNPNVDFGSIQRISFGNKRRNAGIVQDLSLGELSFDDLIKGKVELR